MKGECLSCNEVVELRPDGICQGCYMFDHEVRPLGEGVIVTYGPKKLDDQLEIEQPE